MLQHYNDALQFHEVYAQMYNTFYTALWNCTTLAQDDGGMAQVMLRFMLGT